MIAGTDPVADGLVNSLARPGGNITGLSTLTRDLGGKRFELLAEMLPQLSRVGVLNKSDEPSAAAGVFEQYRTAANALKIQIQSLEVRGQNHDFGERIPNCGQGVRECDDYDHECPAVSTAKANLRFGNNEPLTDALSRKCLGGSRSTHVLFNKRD
jgi:hypothetical protein